MSEEDKKRLKCSNTCAYEQEEDSETKYCFKPGQLESSCEEAGNEVNVQSNLNKHILLKHG